jgi:DNA polymerase-3 subunit epsilon
VRQVVLDTETTGLEVNKGHRIVEIGCVELLERRLTGREFHCYLNPQRAMDEGATAVTGITDDFLEDKPFFAAVAGEFLAFIDGAELIAHNAAFDMGFLASEFGRLEAPVRIVERVSVLDTLALAREKFPGQKNNLDALCKRLDVDNGHRDLHGALLDAQLLANVYLAMTAGQGDLGLGMQNEPARQRVRAAVMQIANVAIRVRRAEDSELAAHEARLAAIQKTSKDRCRWSKSATAD